MAIIYNYPLNSILLAEDMLIGTSTKIVNGQPKNATKNFSIADLTGFIKENVSLNDVLLVGNTSLLDAKIGKLYLYDTPVADYGNIALNQNRFSFNTVTHGEVFRAQIDMFSSFSSSGYRGSFEVSNITANRVWDFPDESGTVALLSNIPSAEWGSITGDIEDQTDLVNYVANELTPYFLTPTGTILEYVRGDGSLATLPGTTIPTWQETLDVDYGVSNIVTTPFYYDDGIVRNSNDIFGIRTEQLTGDLLTTNLIPGQLSVSNSTSGKSLYIDYDFGIQFYKIVSSFAKSTYIKADNVINNNVIFQLPNKVTGTYILATLDDIPSLTGYVPYTGATADLNLGTYNLTADHINLNVSPSGAGFVVGSTQWNNDLGSSQTLLKGGSVILKNGVDLVARVVNKVTPNTTLTKAAYQVVRISGAQGQRLAVDLAQGDTDLNSADTLGVVTETITTNQEGFILTVGQLLDINTTGSLQGETWADGDVLYLSPTIAGRMTNIKPTGANGHIVVLGYVEYAHANNGKIYVKIMNGWELDELHNVFIDNPLNNQILSYNSAVQLWENKDLDQIVSERRNANNSTNSSINYCGTASNGSAESSPVWTITRLTITASGSVTTATATNVAWTNRESAIYT